MQSSGKEIASPTIRRRNNWLPARIGSGFEIRDTSSTPRPVRETRKRLAYRTAFEVKKFVGGRSGSFDLHVFQIHVAPQWRGFHPMLHREHREISAPQPHGPQARRRFRA